MGLAGDKIEKRITEKRQKFRSEAQDLFIEVDRKRSQR